MNEQSAIAVVGSGYVGLVSAACFAEIGHRVICVDNDEDKVRMLNEGGVPIHEEYLPELLGRHRRGSIKFTTDLHGATAQADAVFIAVGTPQSDTGDADLSYVDSVASEIAHSVDGYKVIIEKSTVPVYTNEWITRILEQNGAPKETFDVVSNPEFLREGTGVTDFLHPNRIVIGVESERAANVMRRIYEPLTSGEYYKLPHAVPGGRSADNPPPLVEMSTKAAELTKHATNAFLAMKISFINAVANICDAAGVNVEEVAKGIGMDERIGPHFLRAGIGYGGSCFPKDVAAFRWVAEQLGQQFDLLAEVEKINSQQKKIFFRKIRSALWTLRGKNLAVFGLAFKGGTDDIRESPAIEIVQMLLKEGSCVTLFDPAAAERTKAVIPEGPQARYATDMYEAAHGAHAVVILSDWQEFAAIDLDRLRGVLRHPIVIDGRNLFDPRLMLSKGFTYFSVGRPYPAVGAKTLKEQ
ncbi:MAG TPA: UDP-glucose/GDP-mannose dehydrogenase family protein [Acidobacteriaceae bacterium]|nr:UDP-glucose/GDP-mannose dehydrogenase family protein [Acidobacteriaceae bacterium]